MKEPLYRTFIKRNKIDTEKLPKEIATAIIECNDLSLLLYEISKEKTKECEREIYKSLQHHFSSQLENNEIIDADDKKEDKKILSDEQILDGLKRIMWTENIRRSKLKSMGIKAKIIGREIKIGEHTLKRSKLFFLKYNLR